MTAEELRLSAHLPDSAMEDWVGRSVVSDRGIVVTGSCAPVGEPSLGARPPVFAAVSSSCWLYIPVEPPPASVPSSSSPYLLGALLTLGVSLVRGQACVAAPFLIAGTGSMCSLQLSSNVQK